MRGLLVAGVLLAIAVPAGRAAGPRDAAPRSNVAAHYVELLDRAWGPEPPERLAQFLEARRAIQPVYARYRDGIAQWALREASTRPLGYASIIGVLELRKALDAELARLGLSEDDYTRLAMLVYGRWLRAVRTEPAPEVHLLRSLQEIGVGLERQLKNHPPDDAATRAKLEDRLASVRFQARHVAVFALPAKAEVLARIDGATRQWLEAHRAEVEAVDFDLFDTAAPPRPKSTPNLNK